MSAHKNIGEALVAFQGDVPTLPKDATNPHFRSKFTPLDTIVERIRPILAKHGLAWSALPCTDHHGNPALRYELRHGASGEVIGDTMPLLLTKSDPQGLGSSLTYARRYAISAVLNLVSDEDDDGNAASRPPSPQHASNGSAQPTAQPAGQTERPASANQRGLINARAGEKGLEPHQLADAIRKAAKAPIKTYETDEQARQDVNRLLDRLPARLVDPVLEGISAVANDRAAA